MSSKPTYTEPDRSLLLCETNAVRRTYYALCGSIF